MLRIVKQTNGHIEDQKILRDIIDATFVNYTCQIFKTQLMVYTAAYVIPLVILIFTENPYYQTLCCGSIIAV